MGLDTGSISGGSIESERPTKIVERSNDHDPMVLETHDVPRGRRQRDAHPAFTRLDPVKRRRRDRPGVPGVDRLEVVVAQRRRAPGARAPKPEASTATDIPASRLRLSRNSVSVPSAAECTADAFR